MDKIVSDRLKASRTTLLEKEDKDRKKTEKLVEDLFEHDGMCQDEQSVIQHSNGLSKTKATSALKSQINVRTKMLKCVGTQKVTLGKCNVEQLKQYLLELLQIQIPDGLLDLAGLLVSEESLVSSLKGCGLEQ